MVDEVTGLPASITRVVDEVAAQLASTTMVVKEVAAQPHQSPRGWKRFTAKPVSTTLVVGEVYRERYTGLVSTAMARQCQ